MDADDGSGTQDFLCAAICVIPFRQFVIIRLKGGDSMENSELRERFTAAQEAVAGRLRMNTKVIAAILLGSVSHDRIWEWSDLQILCITEGSYKGPADWHLLENGMPVLLNMRGRNAFLTYLRQTHADDYYYCAVSKGRVLFTKDDLLMEELQEYYRIGDRERETEMLLGFSSAVYYLNKTEKNLLVKRDLPNAAFFAWEIAPAVAWIEVMKRREIPEREIIAQAGRQNPALFEKLYGVLVKEEITEQLLRGVITEAHRYLRENTEEVYRPVLRYLRTHRDLTGFSVDTHDHGFGVNYDWLYRMGITERYPEPVRMDGQAEIYYENRYRLKPNGTGLM